MMHEMSLMQSVLEIIEDTFRSEGFGKVKKVFLEIGALSGVDPQAMAFCFDAVMKGTLAEGAVLEITRKPGKGRCLQCAEIVDLSQRYDGCPRCGSCRVEVTGGEEMRVKEIEVE